jgi:hypothetical protein
MRQTSGRRPRKTSRGDAMLDCPVCTRTRVAEEICPQCGTDLGPLRRLAELKGESQPPPAQGTGWKPAVAAAATFLLGLAIVPAWQKVHPPPAPPSKPVAVAPPPKPAPVEVLYTVRSGDNLRRIAKKKYGMEVLWTRIRDDNKDRLPDPGRLAVGSVIRLPVITIAPN